MIYDIGVNDVSALNSLGIFAAIILIIDDGKMLCTYLSEVVRSLRHDVTCAYTIREGLDRTTSEAVDVLFFDVWMPDGN